MASIGAGRIRPTCCFFEQSSSNVIAYNSATHGGDGFFLWAGQSTMDTGDGGANDNLVYKNDFSYAPANAIEATFSRNTFVANIGNGSDYGLWGGYSYSSIVAGNCFLRDRIGAAIEHGQDNAIVANRFDRNDVGVRLWADSIAPSDWAYPKHSRHAEPERAHRMEFLLARPRGRGSREHERREPARQQLPERGHHARRARHECRARRLQRRRRREHRDAR